MRRSDFHYDLPDRLIAQRPAPQRSGSRLLTLDRRSGDVADRRFSDLPGLLEPGDLLVFNDTRVIPARLYGRKDSGGRVEILVERVTAADQCLAQIRASKTPREGGGIVLKDGTRLEVLGREGEFFRLRSSEQELSTVLDSQGHIPLPPYIDRPDSAEDQERYQTVYARRPGAVAAPTAGLHFDAELLEALSERGIQQARVTLHVGAGTFQPVRCELVEEHRMHAEFIDVGEETCGLVNETRARGGRVIAVGTTSVRSLETAAGQSPGGEVEPFTGDSRIFIYPGYEFRSIDGLLTNFHLPESTLLMLVAAFAGLEPVLAAYRHAIEQDYRFFSYGDAMLLL